MSDEARRRRLANLRSLDQTLRRFDLRIDPNATARRIAEDYGLAQRLNPREKWHILKNFEAVITVH